MADSDKVFKMPVPAEDMTAQRLRVFYRDYPFGTMEAECTKEQLEAAERLPGRVCFSDFNPEYQTKYPNAAYAWERIVFLKESQQKEITPGWTLVPMGMATKVISMCVCKDILLVATDNGVYRLEGDVLKPLKFEVAP